MNGCLREVSKVFQGSFNEVLRVVHLRLRCVNSPLRVIQGSFKVYKGSSKGVSRQFQRCFKEDSRVLKKVSSVFQENFIKSFKGVSRIFQWSFVLQFCCCMNLIAATRAEGGLVNRVSSSKTPKITNSQIDRLTENT